MRNSLCVLVVLLGLTLSAGARANGRFPTSQFVVVGPGPASDFIALRTTFGVLVSEDSGRTWNWHCEELFEYGGSAVWDPPIAIGSRGPDGVPLLVGVPDGLLRATDRCEARRVPEVGRDYTGDVTADATGRELVWVASSGSRANRVFRSSDGGRTFVALNEGVRGVLFETVELSDSDPRRVYFTGVTESDRRPVLYRSDDGGRTLLELPLNLHGGRDAWLAGVDPTNPDVLWLRSTLLDDAGMVSGTLLLRSGDGGRNFTVAHQTRGPMLGFAYSADGRTLWLGGPNPEDGLQRSDDGGRFQQVSTVQVLCLRWHAGALYVCQNHTVDGVALARSDDGGRSRVPLLRFDALEGPASCPAGTVARDLCALRWLSVRRSFTVPDAGTLDAGRPTDAGTPAPRSGCCSVPSRPLGGSSAWWALGAALLVLRRPPQRAGRASLANERQGSAKGLSQNQFCEVRCRASRSFF
jgi:hypothetical protein